MIIMKKNSLTKLKSLAKCILCIVLCYYLITILLSWNRIMHFKNYVYLSHPMSSKAYSDCHFTIANVKLCFSNKNTGIQDERYEFSICNKKKDSLIVRPQVSTIDTLGAFFTPSILNNRDVAIGQNLLGKVQRRNGGHINNAFGAIRFSSPFNNSTKYHEVELYQGGNPNSYIINKNNTYDNASAEFWHEEDVFYTLLDALRKWELDEYRTSIFRFSDEGLMVNTYYGLGEHNDSTVIIKPKENTSWTDFLNLLLAPYDISKAKYDCMFMAYELDSTNVQIRFNESVEISEIDNSSFVDKDLNSLRFSNWGVRQSVNLTDGFYISFDGKSKTSNYDGWAIRNYKEDEALSFNVKFLESRTLQWFRLFFLTTIIAYLLAIIAKEFFHLVKK